MKSKIIISIVAIAVLVLGAAGFLFYRNFFDKPAQEPVQSPEETPQESTIIKDGFSIILPVGWQEINNNTVLMMAVDTENEIVDPALEKIGFQTNFSLKKDNFSKYAGIDDMQAYVEDIKVSLVQMISGIKFTAEEKGTIDGRPAVYIECLSTQREISFKTLLVFVGGQDQDVWAISFNTSEYLWPSYRDLFYHIAGSFKLI